jgi:AcrR family transcriptional regulator
MATPPATTARLLPDRVAQDGTHRRLLEEALLLFSDRGFHGVSVREIAEAAGVRASSMYAHIESKEELLFQIVLGGHEEHSARLREALLGAGSDPIEQIRALTRAHVRMHAELALIARVSNRELHALKDENRRRIDAIRDASVELFMDVMRRGSQMGVFEVDDPFLATAAIGAMGLRVAEWWGTYPGYTVDQVAETYAGFAVKLLTP